MKYQELTKQQINDFIYGTWKTEAIENDAQIVIKIFIGDKIRVIKKVNNIVIENELFPKSSIWLEELLFVSPNYFIRNADENNLTFGEFKENTQLVKWQSNFKRVEESEWLSS